MHVRNPIRPMFIRASRMGSILANGLAMLLLLIMAGAILFSSVRVIQRMLSGARFHIQFEVPAEAPKDVYTADGKLRCEIARTGVSCLPVWLVDRPENWMLYSKPKP